jgi:DnaK suppressor protein
MTDLNTTLYAEQLRALQTQLEADSEIGDAAASVVELDQSRVGRLSRMDALQAQSMSQASQRRREQQLRDIAAALNRIEVGRFGACLDCDEPINPKRLSFDPSVRYCLECATERDA